MVMLASVSSSAEAAVTKVVWGMGYPKTVSWIGTGHRAAERSTSRQLSRPAAARSVPAVARKAGTRLLIAFYEKVSKSVLHTVSVSKSVLLTLHSVKKCVIDSI